MPFLDVISYYLFSFVVISVFFLHSCDASVIGLMVAVPAY